MILVGTEPPLLFRRVFYKTAKSMGSSLKYICTQTAIANPPRNHGIMAKHLLLGRLMLSSGRFVAQIMFNYSVS